MNHLNLSNRILFVLLCTYVKGMKLCEVMTLVNQILFDVWVCDLTIQMQAFLYCVKLVEIMCTSSDADHLNKLWFSCSDI